MTVNNPDVIDTTKVQRSMVRKGDSDDENSGGVSMGSACMMCMGM